MLFKGDFSELKNIIKEAGFTGEWTDDGAGKHTLRCPDRAVLNWWKNTGTVSIQGNRAAKDRMEDKLSLALSCEHGQPVTTVSSGTPPTHNGKRIFIVHGHDTTARDQLELALRRLGVEPFILMNSSGSGKTLIESLEGHIGRDYSSAFGIALMTPDDRGYSVADGPEKRTTGTSKCNFRDRDASILFNTQ